MCRWLFAFSKLSRRNCNEVCQYISLFIGIEQAAISPFHLTPAATSWRLPVTPIPLYNFLNSIYSSDGRLGIQAYVHHSPS